MKCCSRNSCGSKGLYGSVRHRKGRNMEKRNKKKTYFSCNGDGYDDPGFFGLCRK